MSDDEIEVEVPESDQPSGGAKVVASESGDDGIEELKRKLSETEQRAQRAESVAQQANTARHETDMTLVAGAINTLRSESEQLKVAYRDAMSLGDFDKAAEINAAMSAHAAKIEKLNDGLEQMKQIRPQPVAASQDPVERIAADLTPRSANWVRRHPEYARDPRKLNKMVSAHHDALGEGHVADSDAYFEHVERSLGISNSTPKVDDDSPMSGASQATKGRQSPAAAPVSRTGPTTGSKPNIVRLTPEEREIASLMKMSAEEYAKNKIALKREGKIN